MQRLDDWSRMNREIHVRFSESLRGQFPWATRLLRQFFPKGTRFEEVTERAVKSAKRLLNRRPRKGLGYATPMEVFFGISFGENFAFQG